MSWFKKHKYNFTRYPKCDVEEWILCESKLSKPEFKLSVNDQRDDTNVQELNQSEFKSHTETIPGQCWVTFEQCEEYTDLLHDKVSDDQYGWCQ